MAWGVGIILHTAIVIILNLLNNSKQISLAIHASITMITSSYLIWNDWWDDNRLNWILFAIVPLILIWLNHFGLYRILRKSDLSGKSRFDYLVEKETNKLRIAGHDIAPENAKKIVMNRVLLQNHILIYAAVNTFLFVVNLLNDVDYWWFLWPTISWGMNILFHALYYVNLKKKTLGEKITFKYLLAYPLTLGLYLVFVDAFSDSELNWFWWPVGGLIVLSLIIAKLSSWMQMKNNSRAPVPAKQIKEDPIRRFCRNCGAPIKQGFQFCESCGQRI